MTTAQIFYETPTAWLYAVKKTPSIDEVIDAVSKCFEVERSLILGRWRARRTVDARHAIRWLLLNKSKLTCTVIARHFGVDHTSVLHSSTQASNLMATDDVFLSRMEGLIDQLYGTKSKKKVA